MIQVTRHITLLILVLWILAFAADAVEHRDSTRTTMSLEAGFKAPASDFRPETWFHLIGGNVSKPGLTVDLEAVASAGISGIQLFHGRGSQWPGVSPQITCLSPSWDDMIAHVGNETQRLGLRFTMQNCPGWAMSGGPWITPDKAMRHLIWSRRDIAGGSSVTVNLDRPQPSNEDWRDYRDVAVVAFPTPVGDTGRDLIPMTVRSNRNQLPWAELLAGSQELDVAAVANEDPTWVEVAFEKPVLLRSIALPPVEHLMKRRVFDPDSAIRLQASGPEGWVDIGSRPIPRGVWQDRQLEMPLILAFSDCAAKRFRILFENKYPMHLNYLRLSSDARIHDWRAQAGFVLRSLDRRVTPTQNPAAWVPSASIVDLSQRMDENGRLSWDAPEGQWTLLRFGHVNTGVTNKPAPPEATGFECDKLSRQGADLHFAGYIGRLCKPGGVVDRGRLQGMLIDSWECYTQTWTPAMEQAFVSRRGYALRPWLPALAGWVVDSHQTSERFLRDWRATISDLLVDNYFGRLAELGHQQGLKLSFETAVGDISPGDILQYFGKADIPMCELWQPNDPHWGGFEMKPVHPTVSAAHIYGKPRVAAEAFTNVGLRWDEHPFMLKHKADQHFALGINHLVYHTYTHNPRQDLVPGTSFGSRIGTPFLRGQTWWKYMPLFTDYLARCQYLLQQGQPVSDVLWYLGDDLDHKPRQDSPFPAGYKFDYVNFDALVNRIHVADGHLSTPEGIQWKVLWLPSLSCQRLTPETLTRLYTLLQAGATVLGPPPLQNPSLSGGAQAKIEFAALVKTLWGGAQASGDRRVGKGRLIWGENLESTLLHLGIAPDVTGARSATWCHRRQGKQDIYFVSADRIAALDATLRFRAQGRPEFWDPMTGTTTPVTIYHRQGEHTLVPVQLPVAGSTFIVFQEGTADPLLTKIVHQNKTWVDAADPTHVDQGDPYPNYGLTPKEILQPWIDPAPLVGSLAGGQSQLVAWQNGRYICTCDTKTVASVRIEGTRDIPLMTAWTLAFPLGWGALSTVDLPVLKPWSVLEDPATRAFSGTATYSTTFTLETRTPDERFLLDLGRVAHIAEIALNGKKVTTLWAPPFRADLTPYVQVGSNHLSVKVTNTWYNRLIFDAGLPKAERKTWTINGPEADTPMELAGLVGPVKVCVGQVVHLN